MPPVPTVLLPQPVRSQTHPLQVATVPHTCHLLQLHCPLSRSNPRATLCRWPPALIVRGLASAARPAAPAAAMAACGAARRSACACPLAWTPGAACVCVGRAMPAARVRQAQHAHVHSDISQPRVNTGNRLCVGGEGNAGCKCETWCVTPCHLMPRHVAPSHALSCCAMRPPAFGCTAHREQRSGVKLLGEHHQAQSCACCHGPM